MSRSRSGGRECSLRRLQRASKLFAELVELDPDQRRLILERTGEQDPELRAEVESLLAHHDDSFLAQPIRIGNPDSVDEDAEFSSLERLGEYRLDRILGRGGMGVVYEACEDELGRRVALKLIRADLLGGGVESSFRREARVLARLQHPGIAQVFNAGHVTTPTGPQPFIAMELVDGVAIDRFVAEQSLPVNHVLELMLKLCDGVLHAHERGIVHRDLKPDNVLVDRTGRPRILDFGVARMTDVDHKLSTLKLGTGTLVGTLPYMSPEQAAGAADRVDVRTDIYALGVILFELLTGSLPLDLGEMPLHRMVEAIQNEPPTPLRRIHPTADEDLETILLKCLEKEPDRRYWAVADLSGDLERLLRHEPIRARPPTIWNHLYRFSQRHRAFVIGVGAVAASLLIGAVLSGIGFWQAHQRSVQVL